jgi:3-dehydroquinate synthase
LKFEKTLDTFIIALGGGVVGDLSGFIASIYKRGIPYIQIPTTLLGQIDSGIGGKTAVDLKEAKNMIGTFYQPALVLNDISLLKTLSPRQMRSGIAEAIKYGIIRDSSILDYIERYLKEIMAFNENILEDLVYRCAKIKAEIVEIDEKEKKNIRTILNFGHTLGHALETASGYRLYTHGEAIGIGMLTALYIGVKLKITPLDLLNRVRDLMRKVGLPLKINQKISVNKIIQAYYYDKKFKAKKNRFILIKNFGKTIIKENIPLSLVREAVKSHL